MSFLRDIYDFFIVFIQEPMFQFVFMIVPQQSIATPLSYFVSFLLAGGLVIGLIWLVIRKLFKK
jgi:hypothetical protein